EEKVGQGGMGVVYRAHDRELDEEVAVKFLVPDLLASGGHSVDRFKQEIKVARRVSHHNIVRTHDFGEADGTPFISMEYLVGVTLKDLVARAGPVPLGVGLRIARELCQGLDAAHREGIVHRDVKPHNVLLLPDKGELKIMDFGIARSSQIHRPGTTVAGTIIGTPAYMSPEQALGKPADLRSDIYSLGVLFFEMFLGRLPFSGDTAMEVLHHHIQTPPPPARSLNPGIPVGLEAVILRCLEKDPADRYPSVSDILPELAAISTSLDPSA
ncbi:MAG TPA: serine/threonine-protein kinase, partial [Actinomycetota bacterium]|nr:serine/threonine-protein kinase [Actinomycetota bacterium]